MLIPGFLSTKLTIEIDCEVLRDDDESTFSECGWDSCKFDPLYIYHTIPEKEYEIWVPGAISPMSIVGFLHNNICFSKLIKPTFK